MALLIDGRLSFGFGLSFRLAFPRRRLGLVLLGPLRSLDLQELDLPVLVRLKVVGPIPLVSEPNGRAHDLQPLDRVGLQRLHLLLLVLAPPLYLRLLLLEVLHLAVELSPVLLVHTPVVEDGLLDAGSHGELTVLEELLYLPGDLLLAALLPGGGLALAALSRGDGESAGPGALLAGG